MLWNGLADPHITPLGTITYHETLQRQMGHDRVDSFERQYTFLFETEWPGIWLKAEPVL